METIIVKESDVVVFGDDLDGPDAQDARETALREDAEKLLTKAEKLRMAAEKLLAKAKAAEDAATECLKKLDMGKEELDTLWNPELWEPDLDPEPVVSILFEGRGYALDPVELELCGVKDLDDVEVLEQYIGSSADVTELLGWREKTTL